MALNPALRIGERVRMAADGYVIPKGAEGTVRFVYTDTPEGGEPMVRVRFDNVDYRSPGAQTGHTFYEKHLERIGPVPGLIREDSAPAPEPKPAKAPTDPLGNALTLARLSDVAALASVDGENPEYDRALVEASLALLGLGDDDRPTVERLLLGARS